VSVTNGIVDLPDVFYLIQIDTFLIYVCHGSQVQPLFAASSVPYGPFGPVLTLDRTGSQVTIQSSGKTRTGGLFSTAAWTACSRLQTILVVPAAAKGELLSGLQRLS
jgi:hypothetical protein